MSELSEAWEKYSAAFPNAPFLSPFGVGEEVLAAVMLEHVKLGKPIPGEYEWYGHLPDGAVA